MSWGAVIGAGAGIIGGALAGQGAKDAAKKTKPKPYGVTGPAGQVSVDGNNLNLSMADNPFSAVFQALGLGSLGNAASAYGMPLSGANNEVLNAYRGMYGQGLTNRIDANYDLLSQLAAPQERRDSLALDDQSFARGMLGTTGGAERFRALEEAQAMADLARQKEAIGLGQTEAANRFQAALGGSSQGMANQLQQYNIGQGSFGGLQQLMQNLFQQAGLGVAAGGGQAPGAAMYAAQASMAPWQAGANFLQNSGLLNFGAGAGGPIYPGGGAPMVSQPSGPISIPGVGFPMPSGNFGL